MAMIKKDQYSGIGCVVALFILGVVLPTILAILSILDSRYWDLFWFYLVIFPLAWAGFLIGFWKPFIGGIILILTGLTTIVGYPIIIINTPGVEQGPILTVPVAFLIGLVLLAFGYLFIIYRRAGGNKKP